MSRRDERPELELLQTFAIHGNHGVADVSDMQEAVETLSQDEFDIGGVGDFAPEPQWS